MINDLAMRLYLKNLHKKLEECDKELVMYYANKEGNLEVIQTKRGIYASILDDLEDLNVESSIDDDEDEEDDDE